MCPQLLKGRSLLELGMEMDKNFKEILAGWDFFPPIIYMNYYTSYL
jgi:hypothetical protein